MSQPHSQHVHTGDILRDGGVEGRGSKGRERGEGRGEEGRGGEGRGGEGRGGEGRGGEGRGGEGRGGEGRRVYHLLTFTEHTITRYLPPTHTAVSLIIVHHHFNQLVPCPLCTERKVSPTLLETPPLGFKPKPTPYSSTPSTSKAKQPSHFLPLPSQASPPPSIPFLSFPFYPLLLLPLPSQASPPPSILSSPSILGLPCSPLGVWPAYKVQSTETHNVHGRRSYILQGV